MEFTDLGHDFQIRVQSFVFALAGCAVAVLGGLHGGLGCGEGGGSGAGLVQRGL